MKPATGQVLRRIGLLVETLCLLTLVSLAREKPQPQVRKFAGIELSQWLMAGLALGFALWIVGTATIYRRRKASEPE
jgi:hypothetical protein